MKTILIGVILMLLPFLYQDMEKKPVIKGIQQSYAINDTVNFTIENPLDSSIYYYLGVEKYLNNEWREVIIDITNPTSRRAKILHIDRTGKMIFTVRTHSIIENRHSDSSKYRIILNYGFSINDINKRNYSEPFRIQCQK
jgi:hypothetical protein